MSGTRLYGSFFQRDFIRKQRDIGLPLHLIAHEDVLVFRTHLSAAVADLRPGATSERGIAEVAA